MPFGTRVRVARTHVGQSCSPRGPLNRPLPDARGAGLVPDACLDEALLVIEVDSVEWHRFGDAPETTERRRARLAALGWTVVPLSPRRIREEPVAVLGEIEAACLAGIARAARSPEAV